MTDAPKQYDIAGTEAKWQQSWLENRVYAWDPTAPRAQSFVIDTPPPTVSGILHIGHVYSYTQTDLIARFQRMSGKNVYYPMGFDDNGLPTERLVEERRKVRATEMSREDFIKICSEEVKEAEADFRALFREIALSIDWTQEFQTVSPHSRRISQLSVLDLFEKGHLYRRPQPSLWDPGYRTALAQAEVNDKESPGTLWQIRFDVADAAACLIGSVEIATTRPELMGACVALLIHPEHPRAAELIGRQAVTPLFRVPVPILADDRADPEKGTGVVMCCTFGDTTDIEWWRDHQLPTRVIVSRDGRIGPFEGLGAAEWPSLDLAQAEAVATELQGLKINAARLKMVELLTADDRVTGATEVLRMVPTAERSGAPLEILVTPQWFVRVLDQKEALLAKGAEVNWYPDFMRQRFDSWVDGLKWDWCISRQRYFGVPFPFWYSKRAGEEGKILVAHPEDLPVNPLVDLPRGYAREEVDADPDVMDTWATSSVSPQINAWGISSDHMLNADRYSHLFPADLRPQAHEIIRTWAFYTIVKSHLHADRIPWRDIAISGWCLAPDRTKMSKSKGNALEPRDLLKKYGADVLRYWTATSKLGLDTAISEDVLKVGKRLQTKLWNAARFVMLQLEGFSAIPTTPAEDMASGAISATLDRWVLSRLAHVVERATERFKIYEYADALESVERFFWADFCDNYLELVKGRSYGEIGDAAGRLSAQLTLWHCLETVLRLLAPVMPHLTEELYAQHFPARSQAFGSIHAKGTWPKQAEQGLDETEETAGQAAVQILAAIRKVKSERKVSIKTPITRLALLPLEGAPDVSAVLSDLAHTVAAPDIMLQAGKFPGEPVATEDGLFSLDVELALPTS